MKQPDFLHVDTNSHKLNVDKKILVGYGQKWVWPVWSWDSKIDCFSRMNWIDFLHVGPNIEKLKVISMIFG